ncbi:MAG: lysylphosphatidylglycerol synthase transmembrane domain-containing protein [Polyangiales bacterium]
MRSTATVSRAFLRVAPYLLRVVGVVGLVAGIAAVARTIDRHALVAALAGANVWLILLAAALNFVTIGFKSTYWWSMVNAAAPVSLAKMYRYTILSVTGSALAPARAGDVLRVYLLRRDNAVAVRFAGTIFAIEKVADVAALLLILVPVPWLMPQLPAWVATGMRALSIVAALAIVALIAMNASGRLRSMLKIPDGMHRHLPLGFAAIVGSWLMDMVEVALVLAAVGVTPSWAMCALILLAINFAISIPATPGNAGALELGATAALNVLGVAGDRAIGFALLYHAMQLIPVIGVGLVLGRGVVRVPDASDDESVEPAAVEG